MRDNLFESGGRERVYRLQERRTSCFKSNTPKSCTWSRVKVPPRVSGKEPRGSQSRSRCSWACAASGTRGLQSSAARRRSSILLPRGRQVSHLLSRPLESGQWRTSASCRVSAPGPRCPRPEPSARLARRSAAERAPGRGPARFARRRARAQGPPPSEAGVGAKGGGTGGGEGGGGGGRSASGGAGARPRACPPPRPSPARVKRFLPACSGRRDLIPRWRTARMSTIPKRAACPFSIQR